jgi:sugar phosphate isomerase/epimerase
MILNGEDPVAAVRLGMQYAPEFHFCNCVTDPAHPLFGDRHLPFGPPGVLDLVGIGALMRALSRAGYFTEAIRPRLFCEVTARPEDDSLEVLASVREALRTGWALASDPATVPPSPGS